MAFMDHGVFDSVSVCETRSQQPFDLPLLCTCGPRCLPLRPYDKLLDCPVNAYRRTDNVVHARRNRPSDSGTQNNAVARFYLSHYSATC